MTQLEDLDDDCLSQVLDRLPADELFKMLDVNKRMKRLADNMIRNKIKAIRLEERGSDFFFSNCRSHLGAIRHDEVLFLEQLLKNESSKQAFSSVLSKCSAVKCLDTYHSIWSKPMPNGLFMEVVRSCPEIECLKLDQSVAKEVDSASLDLVGNKIVHVVNYKYQGPRPTTGLLLTEVRLLETIAKKCPNIKRVDWTIGWQLDSAYRDLVAAFKSLPTGCWITFDCDDESDIEFEDVVDELVTTTWNWSHFKRRVNRLSSLTWIYSTFFRKLKLEQAPVVRGVEFAGLKKLDVRGRNNYDNYLVGCLVASQFPQLKEFHYNVSRGFTENNFDALFQRMKSVKKLTISWCFIASPGVEPLLPGLAINHLKQLERIELDIWTFANTWKLDVFLQQLEHYVDGIRSLKKLAVYLCDREFDGWKELVKEKVEQLRKKQSRVAIIYKLY